ncbi:MAG: hypothetical protein JZU53_16235 [Paludibacter sp.]|nr:hypothetical protein [Paludibacter sp.]
MKEFARKYIVKIIAILVGGAGGFSYYYFIGCASGTCPITSNPYISVIYGAVLGYLFSDIFKKKKHEID